VACPTGLPPNTFKHRHVNSVPPPITSLVAFVTVSPAQFWTTVVDRRKETRQVGSN
jgi:hypothetical protein